MQWNCCSHFVRSMTKSNITISISWVFLPPCLIRIEFARCRHVHHPKVKVTEAFLQQQYRPIFYMHMQQIIISRFNNFQVPKLTLLFSFIYNQKQHFHYQTAQSYKNLWFYFHSSQIKLVVSNFLIANTINVSIVCETKNTFNFLQVHVCTRTTYWYEEYWEVEFPSYVIYFIRLSDSFDPSTWSRKNVNDKRKNIQRQIQLLSISWISSLGPTELKRNST